MTIAKVMVMTSKTTAATILSTPGPEKGGEYRASRKLRQEKMRKVRKRGIAGKATRIAGRWDVAGTKGVAELLRDSRRITSRFP